MLYSDQSENSFVIIRASEARCSVDGIQTMRYCFSVYTYKFTGDIFQHPLYCVSVKFFLFIFDENTFSVGEVCSNNCVLLQVLHRVNLSVDDEGRLDFFMSFRKDPVHLGSLQLRTGARIGLPGTFVCRTVDDVDCSSIWVWQEKVDWSSAAGEELRTALVLSDKAKAFAIAREIFYVKSFGVHLDTVMLCISMLSAYSTGAVLNQRALLSMRMKPWARFFVFSTIAVAWLFLSVAVRDAVHCKYDNSVDRAAAKLRKIYAEGGVEYYNAVLQRNRALRTLLGSRGSKEITFYGNNVSVWRNPSVQLTTRRDNLLKYLAEYEHEETAVEPDVDRKEANAEV